jgi:acetylornithine/succinyldiaminopimelate/putrescine aminotransferase
MGDLKADFLKHVCQTSGEPLGLEIAEAEGSWITDRSGKRYLDWLAGIGVLSIGHRHPAVVAAVRRQTGRYLHVMVYGEYVQEPQVELARTLSRLSPFSDAQVYFTSSGAEAIDGALKVARKHTRRSKVIAFENSYHGSTFGALSVLGNQALRQPFEPLLEVGFLPFGWEQSLPMIDERVAAVVVEPIQAEGGVRVPPATFLAAVRKRCDQTGALLIFDEVQTGLGRTGLIWGAEHAEGLEAAAGPQGVKPDLIVVAKAIGGGLPLGAFLGRLPTMFTLSMSPALSHLTTFGGNPVSCAAGLATAEVRERDNLFNNSREQGGIVIKTLTPLKRAGLISDVRGRGLLVGVELESAARAHEIAGTCRANGLLVGTALNAENVLRLTPPLNMSDDELIRGLDVLVSAITTSKPSD